MSDLAIKVENLSKVYKLYDRHIDRLKETLHPLKKKYHRDFYALRDVSFEVRKGETVGIIGKNGSGKSTLLKILAGVLTPTAGTVVVNGRVSALLELGTGFNQELTGVENVFFSGALMGYTKEEMDKKIDNILAFADIGEFAYQPVKTYSSGMFVRLAFAVATSVEPEILIVDEALAVGDMFFQQKCHEKMEKLRQGNVSILIVSHELNAIAKYSHQAMILNDGAIYFLGRPDEAVQRYLSLIYSYRPSAVLNDRQDTMTDGETSDTRKAETMKDWPAGETFFDLSKTIALGPEGIARCTKIALCNESGQRCNAFEIAETAYFYTEFEALQDLDVPLGAIELINDLNIIIHSKASFHYFAAGPETVTKGGRIRFRQTIKLDIAPGRYTFVVGFATMNPLDYAHFDKMGGATAHSKINPILRVGDIAEFFVIERSRGVAIPFYGLVNLEGSIECSVL
jgi:lipopolysaccharide transport system ATP-binding protein